MAPQGNWLIVFPSLCFLGAGLVSCHVSRAPRTSDDAKQPVACSPPKSKPQPKSAPKTRTTSAKPPAPQPKVAEPRSSTPSLHHSTTKPSAPPSAPKAVPAPDLTPVDPVKPPAKAAALAGKPITVSNNNATRIIEAKGEDVNIEGDDGLILITGGCRILTIRGKTNQIQVDSADEIVIEGDGNNVASGKLGRGRISGNNNKLSWQSGMIAGMNPIIQTTGVNNETKLVKKPE